MNEAQKAVIQRHYKDLADDIIMNEELLAALFQRKVFERTMIETIKAERTATEQIYKMLAMLTKRGPDAFDSFVDVIKMDYPWLASMMETELDMLVSRQNSLISMFCQNCGHGNGGPKSDMQVDGTTRQYIETPRQSIDIQADPDIKSKVGTFIHKQFGLSKRISQQDKKVMEKWLSEQLQTDRKSRATKSSSLTEDDTQDRSACTSQDPIHKDLERVFNKVRDENLCDLLNSEHANKNFENDKHAISSDEIDSNCQRDMPEDPSAVIANLEGEIDKLINRLNSTEGLLAQCHYILGDRDRKQKLPTLIKDSQYASKQLETEIRKEKAKSEKMLTELYDYCKSIHQLENARQQLRHELDKHNEEIEKIKRENAVLTEKCTMLEAVNNTHLEKEKTLSNLKKMVNDLKSSHTNLADENANYRINYGTGGLRNSRRLGGRNESRRGSTVGQSSLPNSVRKPATKPMFTSSRRTTKPPSRFQ